MDKTVNEGQLQGLPEEAPRHHQYSENKGEVVPYSNGFFDEGLKHRKVQTFDHISNPVSRENQDSESEDHKVQEKDSPDTKQFQEEAQCKEVCSLIHGQVLGGL